jgi:hypothetical protein
MHVRPWMRFLSARQPLVTVLVLVLCLFLQDHAFVSKWPGVCVNDVRLTCLSGSMLAKPELWLAWPPLEAISWTSSLGRLAKLPGLVLALEVLVPLVLEPELLFPELA